ncbi:MAG TPA: hypothetical protein PK711_04135 [Bacteroidales bacterium]|nr:hypothetical protein [Bacteroidales bacterium]HRZ20864.1 hypothetical protein [Bacteroidales bacterium]
MNAPMTVQSHLFELIKNKIPHELSFVHEISELLNISYDSAYRRIRGEKELTLDEFRYLVIHYGLSADTLFSSTQANVLFAPRSFQKNKDSFLEWLQQLLTEIRLLASAEGKQVIYSAKDIPIFHYFQVREIALFKEFIWLKTLFKLPEYSDKLFSVTDSSDEIYQVGQQMLHYSVRIPTLEIWNDETITNLLQQVKFYWESGYFAGEEDFWILCDKMEEWIKHLRKQAELGFKFIYGTEPEGQEDSFKLFYNDFILGDNTVLMLSRDRKTAFLTYNFIYLLSTNKPEFCQEIEDFMHTLMQKSVLISTVSAKERNSFFNRMLERVYKLKTIVE